MKEQLFPYFDDNSIVYECLQDGRCVARFGIMADAIAYTKELFTNHPLTTCVVMETGRAHRCVMCMCP